MTGYTQPNHIEPKFLGVTLVVVCLWFTFLATLTTLAWTNYSAISQSVANGAPGFFTQFFVWLNVFWVIKSPSFRIDAAAFTEPFWIQAPPNDVSTSVGTTPLTAPIYYNFLPAFNAGMCDNFWQGSLRERLLSLGRSGVESSLRLYSSTKNEQVGDLFPGTPSRQLVEQNKIQRQGEVASWPRHKISNQ